jgi:cell division protein ZapD
VVLAGQIEAQPGTISYEFPFTERIRTFLRLENLFRRFDALIKDDSPLAHHQAIMILFEILEGGSRADLKADLLQEMERQRQGLVNLQSKPKIEPEQLQDTISELSQIAQSLSSIGVRIGQHLRENEWLMLIRSRSNIPGGVCEFDLPSYHAWQHESPDFRREMLAQWESPMRPLANAISILMRFLRSSGEPVTHDCTGGSFTQPLAGKLHQLARLDLPRHAACIPELTANKYMIWLRFSQITDYRDTKTQAVAEDFQFSLQLCNF